MEKADTYTVTRQVYEKRSMKEIILMIRCTDKGPLNGRTETSIKEHSLMAKQMDSDTELGQRATNTKGWI